MIFLSGDGSPEAFDIPMAALRRTPASSSATVTLAGGLRSPALVDWAARARQVRGKCIDLSRKIDHAARVTHPGQWNLSAERPGLAGGPHDCHGEFRCASEIGGGDLVARVLG